MATPKLKISKKTELDVKDGESTSFSIDMPEVSQHVVDAHREKLAEEKELVESVKEVDKDGNAFDPELHQTNEDGTPKIGASGKLLKRRGKGGSRLKRPKKEQISPETLQCQSQAKLATALLVTLGVSIFGDEWQPMSDEKLGLDEKSMLEEAFTDYFVATGAKDLPPSLALALAVGAYSLPRFTLPKTQNRLVKFGGWVSKKWGEKKVKGWFKKKGVK